MEGSIPMRDFINIISLWERNQCHKWNNANSFNCTFIAQNQILVLFLISFISGTNLLQMHFVIVLQYIFLKRHLQARFLQNFTIILGTYSRKYDCDVNNLILLQHLVMR